MKKKILIFSIILLIIATFSFSAVAEAKSWKRYRKCDVDMDGRVTRNDADMIARYVVHLISLNRIQRWLADADNDGRILMYDASLAGRTAEGLGHPNCSSYLRKKMILAK